MTISPYLGSAMWFSARIAGELHRDVAWTYRFPIPQLPRIAGLLAFRDELVRELRRQLGVRGRCRPAPQARALRSVVDPVAVEGEHGRRERPRTRAATGTPTVPSPWSPAVESVAV